MCKQQFQVKSMSYQHFNQELVKYIICNVVQIPDCTWCYKTPDYSLVLFHALVCLEPLIVLFCRVFFCTLNIFIFLCVEFSLQNDDIKCCSLKKLAVSLSSLKVGISLFFLQIKLTSCLLACACALSRTLQCYYSTITHLFKRSC